MATSVELENLSAAAHDNEMLRDEAAASVSQAELVAQADPVPVDAGSGQPVQAAQPVANAPAPAAAGEYVADAANIVHLPANVSIDNIKVEGNNLVLEQADGSLIVIKDAAANVPTFLLGDVEVPRVALIAALEAGGVNVAFGADGSISAGPGASASGSGGNFDVALGGIGNGFDLSDLLPPTALAFPQYEERDLVDAQNADPLFGDFSIRLSEEGLKGGIKDVLGDPDDVSDSAVYTGFFGATDRDGDPLTYSLGLPTTPDLTSGGQTIVWELAGPNLLIGRIGGGDDMPGREIIRFEITNPSTGAFRVEIKGPVDHPDKDAEDVISFNVPVTVKDPNGGSATASVRIEVEDDSPEIAATTSAVRDWTLDEDVLTDGAPHVNGNDARDNQFNAPAPHYQDTNDYLALNGKPLGIGWGADGAGTIAFVASGGVPALVFDGSMDAGQLTSGGVPLVYEITNVGDGQLLTAYKGAIGGETVFTLSLDPNAGPTGSFSFELLEELDHFSGSGQNSLTITFPFTAKDGDGDAVKSEVVIRVTDDVPYAPSAPQNLIANGDFTNLTGGQTQSWGTLATGAQGWTLGNGGGDPVTGQLQVELTNPKYLGMSTPGNHGMLDMATSPGNIAISQTVAGAQAGQTYAISFFAGAPFPGTATLEVIWGGQVIGTIHPTGVMTSYSFLVQGDTGDHGNTLTLREIGTGSGPLGQYADEGYHGTYVANVQMLPVNAFVDEDNLLPNGLNDRQTGDVEPGGVSAIGNLGIFWGSDNADIADGERQDGASADDMTGNNAALTGRALYFSNASVAVSGAGGANGIVLTSKGELVLFQLIENGTKLVGYVGSGQFGPEDRLVFEVSLSDDDAGSFKFTLHDQLDHAPNANENDITLKFDYTARDFDGDTATGSFIIGIDDDMPVVNIGTGTPNSTDALRLELDESVQPDNGSNAGYDRYNFGEGESAPAGANGGADDVAPVGQNYNQVPVIEINPDASEAIGSRTTTDGAIGNLFTGWQNPAFGADGPGANGGVVQALSFVLGGGAGGAVATNLSATQTGAPELSGHDAADLKISLYQVDATHIEGRTAGGFVAFRITLNGAGDPGTATITVDQFMAIAHGNTALYDENLALQLADGGSLGIKLDVTVTDADGDKASDSAIVKIGDSSGSFISFDDDGPKVISVVPTVPVLGQELIINGSFEEGHENILSGQDWEIFHSLSGWTSDGGVPFEVQTGGAGGLGAQHGNALIELDSDTVGNPSNSNVGDINATNSTNATIQQTVAGTEAGQTYQLTFWYSPRGDASTAGMKVMFGGVEVFNSANGTYQPGTWYPITVTVTAPVNNAVLAFTGTGAQDAIGALLDNVSLKAVYSASIDDEDAPGQAVGNQGGPGDDGAGHVATGRILFDAGSDGLKSIVAKGIDGLQAIHVDGHGVGTPYGVTQAWLQNASDAGGTLTGTINVPGVGAIPAYTLAIDAAGNYTFTLLQPLVHPETDNPATNEIETSFEDNLSLNFGFTITDGDGDKATGTIKINVDDDSPEFVNGGIDDGVVSALNADVIGQLNLAFGEDGQHATNGLRITGWPELEGVTTTLSDDGRTLTAKIGDQNGPTLYTLQLNNDGTYTFTQANSLPGGGNTLPAVSLAGGFKPIATKDYEGFTLKGLDGGKLNGSGDGIGIDEDGMNPGDRFAIVYDVEMTSAKLGINHFGNGTLRLDWEAKDENGNVVASGSSDNFNSDGFVTIPSSLDPGVTFFSLELTTVGVGGPSPKFKLLSVGGETHGDAIIEKLNFQVTGKDGDGDSVSDAFDVKLGGSRPQAANVSAAVDDDGLPHANPATGAGDIDANLGDLAPPNSSEAIFLGKLQGSGGDGALVFSFAGMGGKTAQIGQEKVEYGWDASTKTLTAKITASPDQSRVGGKLFQLEITDTATGAYKLELLDNVLHTAGDNTEASVFASLDYTVGDSDADNSAGDTATATLTIEFNDDVPVANDLPGGSYVEGAGAQNLGVAMEVLGIKPGADGLGSIVFSKTGTTTGTLAIDDDGHLIYTPAANVGPSGATETFSYTVTDGDGDAVTRQVTFTVTDSGVTGLSATNAAVDEDDISVDGNAGGPGDLTTPVSGGTISYTLGADGGAGVSVSLAAAAVGFTKLDGTPISTAWDADNKVLIGYGTSQADVVFRIKLTSIGTAANQANTATYTVELLQPVKHPGHDDLSTGATETAFEDDLSLTVTATVSDGDGSLDTTSFTVTINDDTPDANDLPGGSYVEGAVAQDLGVATEVLGIKAGADGLGSIVFSNTGTTSGALSIDDDGKLIYTPAANVGPSGAKETFSYTVTDGDGDAVTRQVTFTVTDSGVTGLSATNAAVDEDDISVDGNAGGPGDLTTPVSGGTISYTLGADGGAGVSVSLAAAAVGFTKLDGTPISTAWDADNKVLIGYGTSQADVVFRIKLTSIGTAANQANTATYTVELLQPVKHPGHDDLSTGATETAFEDDLSLTVTATVSDGDGSLDTTSFTVVIDDDTPVANDLPGGSYVEGATAQDLGVATEVLGIKAGADGLGSIVFSNTGTTTGTLSINGSGRLIYTPAANVGPSGATETFSYTVTDGDGDAVTRQVTFTVTNVNVAPVAGPVTLRVSEEGLPTGNPDSKTGSGAQDTTNSSSANGSLNVHDADGDPLTLTFTGALPSLKSGGQDIDWTGNGTGQLVGKVGSATIITLTLDATGQVNVLLSGPLDHASGGGENELSFTLGVNVSDGQASTSTTVTVVVEDDSPENFAAMAMRIENGANAVGSGQLHFYENIGADGGSVAFTGRNGSTLTSGGKAVTSGGVDVKLYGFGTDSLTGKIGAKADGTGGTVVFTIKLHPNAVDQVQDTYTVQFHKPIDDGSQVKLETLDFTNAGNPRFNSIDNKGTADLLFSGGTRTAGGIAAESVNTNKNNMGVGSGQSVDDNQLVRVDFVKNPTITGSNFGDQYYSYGGHYLVNSFSFDLQKTSGTVELVVRAIKAVDNDPTGTNPTDHSNALTNNGSSATVTSILVNGVAVNLGSYVNGGYLLTGLEQGDVITVLANDGFSRLEIENPSSALSGFSTPTGVSLNDDSFKIGAFAYGVLNAAQGVEKLLTFDLTATDADGDKSDGTISLTTVPPGTAISGTGGSEALVAGAGGDTLNAQGGDDWLVGGAGADQLNGGNGNDTAVYRDSLAGVTVDLADNKGTGGDAEGDTYSSIENVMGSNFADHLIGNGEDNILYGLDGNDILEGGAGNDILYGGAGNDTLNGGPGQDTMTGGAGADTFVISADTLGSINDIITDFNPAEGDQLDLSELLKGIDAGADLAGQGYVKIENQGDGTSILSVDQDGSAGNASTFQQVAVLQNFSYTNETVKILFEDSSNVKHEGTI